MKNEFIYSVGEIFSSVLEEAGLKQYYIGPYQRGYKWASENFYDEVPQLLIDVYEAFKNDVGEYYLQYITVLRNLQRESYEVIDGQQRLTTLAIIFDRLSIQKEGGVKSIALGKIEYSRDEIGTTLFDKINGVDTNGNELEDTQDLFYIKNAVSCIDLFIKHLKDAKELNLYARYLIEKVKIILNRESDFVKAEEVFGNLNGNKVELTNAYLIKGLLLTKGINRVDRNGVGLSYFNIIEQRRINGRLWDEIQNWVEQYEVSYFFFGKDAAENQKGMERLLELLFRYGIGEKTQAVDNIAAQPLLNLFKKDLASKNNTTDNFVGFRLFNQFNELIISDNDGLKCIKRLIHLYKKLRTLYENVKLYNLLGYVLFTNRGQAFDIILSVIDLGYTQIKAILAAKALDVLPNVSQEELKYSDKRLTPFLLSFSVFPENVSKDYRFDFITFDKEKWTYEHIRPQHPKTENLAVEPYCKNVLMQLLKRNEDSKKLEEIKSIVEDESVGIEKIQKIFQPKCEDKRAAEQIDKLLIEDVDDFPFLYSELDEEHLHSMGNMALLPGPVNSSVSNKPYVIKRGEIMKKAEEGAFIPIHTIGAFSKSLNTTKNPCTQQFSTDMLVWDTSDVEAHAQWMRLRNTEIINNIKKLISKK